MAAVTVTPTPNQDFNYDTVTEWARQAIVELRKMGFPTGKVAVAYDVTGDVFTVTFS